MGLQENTASDNAFAERVGEEGFSFFGFGVGVTCGVAPLQLRFDTPSWSAA